MHNARLRGKPGASILASTPLSVLPSQTFLLPFVWCKRLLLLLSLLPLALALLVPY